jgi:hypothetical protein
MPIELDIIIDGTPSYACSLDLKTDGRCITIGCIKYDFANAAGAVAAG